MTTAPVHQCQHGRAVTRTDRCPECQRIHYNQWNKKKRDAALALGLSPSYRGRLPMACGCIDVCLCEEV